MAVPKITFEISPELLPSGLCGIYFILKGVSNREDDPTFASYKERRLMQLYQALSPAVIFSDPILRGYRDLHTYFGFSNRNFPAAPETLLENLLKYRRLAHINLLVDIYNLVSLETHLALGAHDLALVQGNIYLRPMIGDEGYLPLGSSEPKKTRPGGYAYIDDANDVLCILDSRQVEKSKVTLATTDCFYVLQGNASTGYATLKHGADRLIELTQQYCGGEVEYLYP
jgi:DNA/RNA-binding domain of Phe-tRNA-synthetase-like protein